MKASIAVATVSGKPYYLIVNELRKKNVPFLSLTPSEPVPIEIKVVITTEKEKHLINHERVLTCQEETETEATINEALQIVQGKEHYQKIIVGIDPGDVFGLAVLGDGKIIETGNCFSVKEALSKVENVLRNFKSIDSVSIKVGDGVPARKEELLDILDIGLPPNVVLESVGEAGTNRLIGESKHRRGMRDIVSAIRIAGRNGQTYERRKKDESNC